MRGELRDLVPRPSEFAGMTMREDADIRQKSLLAPLEGGRRRFPGAIIDIEGVGGSADEDSASR